MYNIIRIHITYTSYVLSIFLDAGHCVCSCVEMTVLSVRVFYQFAGTVPCCICVVLLLTRSTKQCHAAAIRVNPSQNNTSKYEPSHSLHSNK